MKRKIIIRITTALLSLVLLAALMPQTVAHAETALATGYVNTAKLNMRSGAGTGNAIVESLKKDTAVNVYEVVGTWLRIDVPSSGKSGYVSGKYISINASSLSAYALGVTSGKVNLRKSATSKSDSVAVVAKNSGVTIYSADKTTGWYKVKVHSTSQEGYISPTYVKIVCKVVGTVNKEGYINANGVNLR
ncbi:MAG TPA: SH3 domain-containing protein, partial [Negativicutes bacterium]|nr:SH3 domain-containing protein [Negativicutes bacterium]